MTRILHEIIKDSMERQKSAQQEDIREVREVFTRILRLTEVARKEGLLAMETRVGEWMQEKYGESFGAYEGDYCDEVTDLDRLLVLLNFLIVDGTDPAEVEEIAIERYYSFDFQGNQAIAAGMEVIGLLSIQRGVNPRIIRQKLLGLLPGRLEKKLLEDLKKSEKEKEEKEGPDTCDLTIPEEFFADKETGKEKSEYIKGVETLLQRWDNRTIERILRDVEDELLCAGLRVMGGSARRVIFDNVSARQGILLYQHMRNWPCLRYEPKEAVYSILKIVWQLECQGEIVMTGGNADGLSVRNLMALYEHEIICKNEEIKKKIAMHEAEISCLQYKIVKL